MIEPISILNSGLDTDSDILVRSNGDAPYRLDVVYGTDGDFGSMVGIKSEEPLTMPSKFSSWNNKVVIGSVEYIENNSAIFFLYGETMVGPLVKHHVSIVELYKDSTISVLADLPDSMLEQYSKDIRISPYVIGKFVGFTDRINEPILINIERLRLYSKNNPVPYFQASKEYQYGENAYFSGQGLYKFIGMPRSGVDIKDHPDLWEFMGEMYEDFEYESIIRYRKPSLESPSAYSGPGSHIGINSLVGNSFQFATRNIYKDGQYSVLSPYSPVIYGPKAAFNENGTPTDNVIVVGLKNQNSEVSKIELLCRTQDGKWTIIDTVPNFRADCGIIIRNFTNNAVYSGVSEDDVVRPYDYISRRVDASTVINNSIVDGGLIEDRTIPFVDFTPELKFELVDNYDTNLPADIWTATRSNFNNVVDYINVSFDFKFSNPSTGTVLRGGSFFWAQGTVFRQDGDQKLTDPSTKYTFYYLTRKGDDPTKIIDFINKYKPIFLSNTSGDFSVSGLKATWDAGNGSVHINFNVVYSGSFGTALVDGPTNVNASGESVNSFMATTSPFRSLKSSSDVFVGVELCDKNGVFYPVNNIKRISIPTRADLITNASQYGVTFPIVESTLYRTRLFATVTTKLPSWVVGYRFVYFGSSFNYFVQIPTHKIFGETKAVRFETQTPWESYETNYVALNTRMYAARKAKVNIAAKDVFTIVVGDSLSMINSINNAPSGIKAYNFRTISDIKAIRGVDRLKLDSNFEGQDLLALQNGVTLLEVRNSNVVKTTVGVECSKTFLTSTQGTQVDSEIYTCIVRNAYMSDGTADVGLNIGCSVEDMLISDTYRSVVKPEGRTNIYVGSITEKYLKGKLRSGGNYIDNTRINNLNRFEATDYNFVDDQYGIITQMYPVGQNLRVRQERNYATVYIGSIQSVSPDGTTQTLQSKKLLGSVYTADANVGSRFSGYCTIGNREFTFDDSSKSIYRTSQGGIFSISGKSFTENGMLDFKIHKLISDISLNNQTKHVVFGCNNENDILFVTFDGVQKITIGFHIPTQRWISYYTHTPEGYVRIGHDDYMFVDGVVNKMNKGNRKPIIFNCTANYEPTTPKRFRTLIIVGDLSNFKTELTVPSGSNYREMYTRTSSFKSKENNKFIEIPRNMKTSSSTTKVEEKESGIEMRGYAMDISLQGNLKLTSINVNED